ncbi:MAG TPA: phosphotransferase family protein [Acidimicrobiales bacterium]|nr:phosphotransferase family protein [Acidimicrobiales bacterium]
MSDTELIEGIDLVPVTEWLRAEVGLAPPLGFTLIAGGRSNLTFEVRDSSGDRCVLRRPPVHHVLPTAHDMSREFRIVSALGPTSVPVAHARGFCDDPAVNGAPFYVMDYVDGYVLRDAATAEHLLDVGARAAAGPALVDVLADLHALDVDAVGLGDLGRREGYISRQLGRWHKQFDGSQIDGVERVSLVDDVYELLEANIPDQGSPGIVHGDYRLDNTMLGPDGSVMAVLDWEICTLGDPLADVGLLMVYWTERSDGSSPLGIAPTTVDGFSSRAELRQRYAERSGRDLSGLDYYIAFGYWKLACILQGVLARYLGGAGGGDRSGVDSFGPQVRQLADAALSAAAAGGITHRG